MMILGHTFSNNQISRDVFHTSGSQSVDQHISSSSVSYQQTHGPWANNMQLLSLQAKPFGKHVSQFALGLAKHVQDDNALPILLHPIQSELLKVTIKVWKLSTIPPLVNDRKYLKRLHKLQVCVAAALIELLVADQELVSLDGLPEVRSTLQRPEIKLFLSGLWHTSSRNIDRATMSFITELEKFPLSSLTAFVDHEIRNHWPRTTVRYLLHHEMLNKRQAVHVKRRMDNRIDSLFMIFREARFRVIPVLQFLASARYN